MIQSADSPSNNKVDDDYAQLDNCIFSSPFILYHYYTISTYISVIPVNFLLKKYPHNIHDKLLQTEDCAAKTMLELKGGPCEVISGFPD